MTEHSVKEVSQHNTAEDAWMVIHGEVYDLTKYIHDHPGGAEVLEESAGTDASEAFDNVGHSEDANEIMTKFHIGPLAGYKKKPTVKPPVRSELAKSPSDAKKTTKSLPKMINLGIFTGTVAVVYMVCRYYQTSMPKFISSLVHKNSPDSHGLGFFKGLLLGAGVFAVLDTHFVQDFIRRATRSSKPFTAYPAHLKLPKTVANDQLQQRGWLDPVTYAPLPLNDKKMLSHDVCRLTFKLPSPKTIIGLPIGQHVAIKADVDGETVTRSYTPTSNNSDRGVLQLTIKIYPDGKLTNGFLGKLKVGDEVLFRGPKGPMRYHRELCNKIGMVAGGTGITPMFQVIRAVCEDDRDLTQISLIYANKTEEDILLRKELDSFARRYPKNFNVYYMLDKPPQNWKYGSGYVTKDLIAERLPGPEESTKIFLCGPPGMVNASKKSLVSLGYKEPGASAKIEDQVFLF